MKRKIIIDTDPGIDDTIAFCVALNSPKLSILGLTTIFGNTKGEFTAQNALRLSELDESHTIPVARGSDLPLVTTIQSLGTIVHGEDGLGNTNQPSPKSKFIQPSAAEFIVKSIRDNPGEITLLTLGPLTNIALALRLYPNLVNQVKNIVIMGGVVANPGNVNPIAEANMYRDPHAAEVVFSSGCPIVMVGLDVTHKTIITPSLLEEIYKVENPETTLIKQIIPCYQRFFNQYYHMNGAFYAHDPSAMAYVINPGLFEIRHAPIFIETEGRCIGQTTADWDHRWENRSEVNICVNVDSVGVLKLIKESLTKEITSKLGIVRVHK